MNKEILEKYKRYLRGKYRKINTWRAEFYQVRGFMNYVNKPVGKLTEKDMEDWRIHLNQTYKRNSQVRIISSVNQFLKHHNIEHLKQPIPKMEQSNKKTLSQSEFDRYLKASESKPLWHLIALLQTDGLLRPGEFSNLKLSNIDWENKRFYLDDTKTGNNYIIISPMIEKALEEYLPYRDPLQEYKDYLIIIPSGKYKGRPPSPQYTSYIRGVTKRIAAKAGILKKVTPYETIKPTAITLDFDNYVNPKIIQRKARHKNIKTTLLYDHTDDKKLLEHFNHTQIQYTPQTDEERKRLLTDQYLRGELDLQTFKRSLDLLDQTSNVKKELEVGYV